MHPPHSILASTEVQTSPPHFEGIHPPQPDYSFPLPEPLSQLNLNTLIGENYQIQELIGQGGYGVVYKGYDSGLDRVIAVKILTETHPQIKKRFKDEGRLLARLHHAHIIQVYQVGHLDDHTPYLIMEYFGRGSLSSHWPIGQKASISDALSIMDQLLDALNFAHQNSIIHRDIKPANLLYDDQTQHLKVCDFGIARSQLKLPQQAQTTREGIILGSDHYIAPERLEGSTDDPRSDLYSAGVVLYRLLMGKHPLERYAGEALSPQVITLRSVSQEIELSNDLPLNIRRFCLRLLARRPQDRFQTALDARLALQELKTLPATYTNPHSLITSSPDHHTLPLLSTDQSIQSQRSHLSDSPYTPSTFPSKYTKYLEKIGYRSLLFLGIGISFGLFIWFAVYSSQINQIKPFILIDSQQVSQQVSATQKIQQKGVQQDHKDSKKQNHRSPEFPHEMESLSDFKLISPSLRHKTQSSRRLIKSPTKKIRKTKIRTQTIKSRKTKKSKTRAIKTHKQNPPLPSQLPFIYPSNHSGSTSKSK